MKHPLRSPWAWIPTLYFAQGLPYIAVMTISVILYKRLGLSNTDIALYTGWLYLPWVVKPLWSPIVDLVSTKRQWTIAMQLLLASSFAAIAFTLPTAAGVQISLGCFALMAFFSATHDIAADGLYLIALDTSDQALFSGIRTTFYRIATVFGQGVLVMIAGVLETATGSVPTAWAVSMGIMSAIFLGLFLWHSCSLPRTEQAEAGKQGMRDRLSRFADGTLTSVTTFFTKPGVGVALLFILLYRLPEAQLLKLINPFLLDPVSAGGLGMTTAQVGLVYGTIGVICLTAGGIAGGILASRIGLRECLMPMAWCMSLTCLVFLFLSYHTSASPLLVGVCVAIEQLGYGIGFTAFILYLMMYSEGPHATTHYALCTGFMALGMMLPGMAAGWIQENIGYPGFFWWTMICCIATIAVAAVGRRRVPPSFGLKTKKADENSAEQK